MVVKTALILAGGRGTRFSQITKGNIPKALVAVQDKPLLDHVIENLTYSGVKRIVISAGHLHERIASHFAEVDYGVEINLVVEDSPLGTAGAVKYAVEQANIQEDFILTNADTLTTVDLSEMEAFYKNISCLALMALAPSLDLENRLVVFDNENKVTATRLYPSANELAGWARVDSGFLVNAGLYILNPKCLENIPLGKPSSISVLINQLVANGVLYAFPTKEQYFNVGTPNDLELAQRFWRPRYSTK